MESNTDRADQGRFERRFRDASTRCSTSSHRRLSCPVHRGESSERAVQRGEPYRLAPSPFSSAKEAAPNRGGSGCIDAAIVEKRDICSLIRL